MLELVGLLPSYYPEHKESQDAAQTIKLLSQPAAKIKIKLKSEY